MRRKHSDLQESTILSYLSRAIRRPSVEDENEENGDAEQKLALLFIVGCLAVVIEWATAKRIVRVQREGVHLPERLLPGSSKHARDAPNERDHRVCEQVFPVRHSAWPSTWCSVQTSFASQTLMERSFEAEYSRPAPERGRSTGRPRETNLPPHLMDLTPSVWPLSAT